MLYDTVSNDTLDDEDEDALCDDSMMIFRSKKHVKELI